MIFKVNNQRTWSFLVDGIVDGIIDGFINGVINGVIYSIIIITVRKVPNPNNSCGTINPI
jgi:hypothetical protein